MTSPDNYHGPDSKDPDPEGDWQGPDSTEPNADFHGPDGTDPDADDNDPSVGPPFETEP